MCAVSLDSCCAANPDPLAYDHRDSCRFHGEQLSRRPHVARVPTDDMLASSPSLAYVRPDSAPPPPPPPLGPFRPCSATALRPSRSHTLTHDPPDQGMVMVGNVLVQKSPKNRGEKKSPVRGGGGGGGGRGGGGRGGGGGGGGGGAGGGERTRSQDSPPLDPETSPTREMIDELMDQRQFPVHPREATTPQAGQGGPQGLDGVELPSDEEEALSGDDHDPSEFFQS